MINVHALGGRADDARRRADADDAAREALPDCSAPPQLIAVTRADQHGRGRPGDVGMAGSPQDAVLRLARLAQACGLDGVVCSAQEAAVLRRECGEDFLLVTPGIRPAAARPGRPAARRDARGRDRERRDYLVIGRPITRAPDPLAALRAINDEIAAATRRVTIQSGNDRRNARRKAKARRRKRGLILHPSSFILAQARACWSSAT